MVEKIASKTVSKAGRSKSAGVEWQLLELPEVGIVDVWATALTATAEELIKIEKTLSPSELERASRFHFDEHRTRFIVGHARLRQLLGRYLSIPADSIEFERGTNGKPQLAGEAVATGLEFNLSHSDELSLTAITRGKPVGIDLEHVRPLSDANDLVRRFFSKREAAAFAIMPEDQKPFAFFRLWTRKEAWLKATGEGITYLLDQVEVSFAPGEPAQLVKLPEGWPGAEDWSLCHLEPGLAYVGAVALASRNAKVRFRLWDNHSDEVVL
jgi:4'-phosphopantetheinyl transferase